MWARAASFACGSSRKRTRLASSMTAVASFVKRSPEFSPCRRQAITPVDEATRTLSRTDRLPRAQRDDLNNAGLIQRQVGSRMSNRDEGLEQKLRRLLDDLRNFKIANPEAQQQMQNMLERLDMLRDRHLGPAEQGLTRAGKSLEQIAEPPPGSRQLPRTKRRNQTSRPAARPGRGPVACPSQAGKQGDGQGRSEAGSPPVIARIRQAAADRASGCEAWRGSRPRPGPSLSLSSRVRHRILPGDRWRRPRPTRRPLRTSFKRCSTALASSRPTAAWSRTPRPCSRSKKRR